MASNTVTLCSLSHVAGGGLQVKTLHLGGQRMGQDGKEAPNSSPCPAGPVDREKRCGRVWVEEQQ